MYSPKYLICVTQNNNNKYYKMIPNGSSGWIAEYGRVNSTTTRVSYSYSDWDKKYREKLRKGYVDQSSLVEDLVKVNTCTSTNNKYSEDDAINDIVNRLQNMAKKVIAEHYTISSGKVTHAMIEEAQKIITSLMTAEDVCEFNELLMKLFMTIPRKMQNVKDYIAKSKNDFDSIIHKEQDLLDVMGGQVYTAGEDTNNSTDANFKVPTDNYLKNLGLTFEVCSGEDIDVIKKLLGNCAPKFKNAWKVTNVKTREKFDKFVKEHNIYTTKLLFHGSRNENWWSIINSGLVLRPTNAVITGKMFGYGLYYATKAQKSLGYTSLSGSYWTKGNASSGFMALMEVACGKPYDVYNFDSKYYQFNWDKLKKVDPKASCIFAHAGTMLRNDEIVVYKEEQSTIKYLIELSN